MARFHRYEGPLSKPKTAEAIGLCLKNSDELIQDARLLFTHGRYARAFALAIVSLEEVGKIPMLTRALSFHAMETHQWKHFWKRFRSHVEKRQLTAGLYSISTGSGSAHLILVRWMKERHWEKETEALKQMAFYVDASSRTHVTCPSKLFPKYVASDAINLASTRRSLIGAIYKRSTPNQYRKAAPGVRRHLTKSLGKGDLVALLSST